MARETRNNNFWIFFNGLYFIELYSPALALVLSRPIEQVVLHKLLANAFHVKKLSHNPIKSYIKYVDTDRKHLLKSCIIASINHKTKWTAAHVFKQIFFDVLSQTVSYCCCFFFSTRELFSCSTFFKFIFNELCHMIGEIKKGLMVDNK